MYFLTKNKKCSFVYDEIDCNKYKMVGYICEKHVGCHNEKGVQKIVNTLRKAWTVSIIHHVQLVLVINRRTRIEYYANKFSTLIAIKPLGLIVHVLCFLGVNVFAIECILSFKFVLGYDLVFKSLVSEVKAFKMLLLSIHILAFHFRYS